MQWYYVSGGSQQGPISHEEIQRLIISGGVSRETLVWKGGMADWAPAGKTELAAYFPSVTQAPQVPPLPARRKRSTFPTPSGLKTLWVWAVVLYLAPTGLFIVGSVVMGVGVGSHRDLLAWVGGTMLVLAALGGMGSAVVNCVLLYDLWATIQDGRARTTPGKAVGFCFIPFFNIYWIFQAWWGLSKDMNAYMARWSIPAPRVSQGLGLTICIMPFALFLSDLFVRLGVFLLPLIAGVVFVVLEIIFWKQAVNTASAILMAKS